NETANRHIVTVEDPIEFTFRDKKSIIDQREVGIDTESFPIALRHSLRQSPDVILIGEMRDRETMEAAIAAAETGHLVLSTLHTVNAVQTIERIIHFFPPHQHDLIRLQLSLVLSGVVCQRLVPLKDEPGRIPSLEMMINSPTVREMLREGRTHELGNALREGEHYGSCTFNQSLRNLYQADRISLEEALAYSDFPDELQLELRGVVKGTAMGDFDFDY
ncbi:MAG: type IV pilus twitching motility protein PilT, partial [Planctomycetota bacterium]